MNVLQFPKVQKSKTKTVQPSTTIMIVDFKKKQLVGEVRMDNLNETILEQWGEKPMPNKKVA